MKRMNQARRWRSNYAKIMLNKDANAPSARLNIALNASYHLITKENPAMIRKFTMSPRYADTAMM